MRRTNTRTWLGIAAAGAVGALAAGCSGELSDTALDLACVEKLGAGHCVVGGTAPKAKSSVEFGARTMLVPDSKNGQDQVVIGVGATMRLDLLNP